jgi:hypothetical protein
LAIVLSVLPSMSSDYLFVIFKSFLSFFFLPLDNTMAKRKRTRKVWRCQRGNQKP